MPGVVQQYVEREQELRREIEDYIAKDLGYRPADLEQNVKEEFALARRYTSESSLEETASEAASSALWNYSARLVDDPSSVVERPPEELIEVSPQALELAAEIDKEIAQWRVEYNALDGDSYVSRGTNRDTRDALAAIRNHLLSGERDIDLTADITYEQDTPGIALEKDSYETTVGNVSDFVEQAEAIGHRVKTTDFGDWDREHRWDFAYAAEERWMRENEGESYEISL